MELRGKLTTRQAADRLGVCVSAIRRMVYAGELKDIRVSDHIILYSEADIDRVMRKMQARPKRIGRPRKSKPWNGDGQ